ncbi:ABC transporter substrate-binding protein [Albibacillus kandeliae]|uniref:ABC transporter substrate-binding protein n=1 Tax=Albibacillus kandeliae TaxID=2174228 RepID=UPI0018E53249|nr:ABC transporter substrate-binding protein [Albibacillus kandeliae]
MKRRDFLNVAAMTGVSLLGLRLGVTPANAQGRNDVIRVLLEDSPNTFDPSGTGYNPASCNISWNVYDRLVTFGVKPVEDKEDAFIYDYSNIVGQAAESYEVSEDGTTITFKMREGATFHDGRPVTAHDAKWSLDRAVNLPTSKAQLGTGSLTSPDQFTVVDDMTFQITLPQADRFTLPNLCILFPAIINSELAKEHATTEDPWAEAWLKTNEAGGGPFTVSRYVADQQFVLDRFADWKNGEVASAARIMAQIVPVASSRRASAERAEADLVRELSGRDIKDMIDAGKPRVLGISNPARMVSIALNSEMAPFDNKLVRQAVAYAVPYQEMFESVLYSRGTPLFGGSAETTEARYPQPLPYTQDLEKAKALLAEAGMADGFETTFTIDSSLGTTAEPIAILMQEALGKIGVTVKIEKVPSAQMGQLQTDRALPMYIAVGGAWLADPDYFFRIFYNSTRRWNYGNYQNEEMSKLVEETRFETDEEVYKTKVIRMVELAKDDVPLILLWSPFQDTVLSDAVHGYEYMFHGQLELRPLYKS